VNHNQNNDFRSHRIVIVTIDGPAGAGKSSIALQVAQQLGFEFLDTGAMYRAVTLGALQNQLDLNDVPTLVEYALGVELAWLDDRIYLNGQDVTDQIRTAEVTNSIHYLADIPEIRSALSQQQREIAKGRDLVTEGRDQGTEVFPDADCKVFLTASPEERARRRQAQLAATGLEVTVDEILALQNQRDLEDSRREMGRLQPAQDAVVVHSDAMTPEEVLQAVLEIVQAAAQRCCK